MFFAVDEHKVVENTKEVAHKKFPEFSLPPVEKVEEEMDITKNLFYEKTYGCPPKLIYDSSVKYKQLLGKFKTIFPVYILTNIEIQQSILNSNSDE